MQVLGEGERAEMRAVLRINYHTYHTVNKEDKEEYQALGFTALHATRPLWVIHCHRAL